MDEKGRRFAPDDAVKKKKAAHKSADEREEKTEKKHFDREKRLKDKNSKKVEKMLKRQKRSKKAFIVDEDEPVREAPDEETELSEEEDAYDAEQEAKKVSDEPIDVESEEGPDPEEEEDEPEEEIETPAEKHEKARKAKSRKFTKKRIIFAAVIIVILFAVVFYVFNADRLSFHNISNFFRYGVLNENSDERFPLNIQGENVSPGNFTRRGQDICYSSDTKTEMLNNYGKSMYSVQHAFINPIMVTGKNHTILYNLGGTGFQIIDKDGKSYSATTEDCILVADIADNGTYALVTESSGYLSKLYVYDEKNTQIFSYSFADYYVTSVSLNSTGMKAVVSGMSAFNGVEISAIYVLDFTMDKPLHFQELEGNNIIYDVSYLNDKTACAIGRSAAYSINTSSGDIETADYDGRELTAYDINTDTDTYTVSLSSSGNGRNCDIVSYNSAGKEEYTFNIDEKIVDLSTYKNRVALLTNSSVFLYSKDGNKKSEKELNSDPHAVVLYTSSDAYVLCTGYIDSISI